MKIAKSRTEYEALLKSLENERVIKITYFDDPDELGQFHPDWHGKLFHNINYGVGFHTATNRLIALIWGQQFAQYGIDLVEIPIDVTTGQPKVDLFNASITFDVSTLPEWSNIIGKCVRNSTVYWSWIAPGASHTLNEPTDLEADVPRHIRTYYPQDIVISFEMRIILNEKSDLVIQVGARILISSRLHTYSSSTISNSSFLRL